ncbi:MAG: M1 family aminopeptidase [Pseudomonadota bacterium]
MDRLMHLARLALVIGALGLMPLTGTTAAAEERLHHDIDLIIEPASGQMSATDRIDVAGHGHLAIKPAPGIAIDTIKVDGEAIAPTSEGGVTWIALPSEEAHQVEIVYGGRLEQADSRAGLSPMITADGVFLPYGIGWLANGGSEDGQATYVLNLDVPSAYKAVATGSLVDEQETEERFRATFEARTPTEPPSVFVGDYLITERTHNDLRLRTYFPSDRQDLATSYLDQVAGYIDRFSQEIGTYPYDGFSVIASPLPVGLGFPGLTYVSSQILHMPFMLTRSLAHEIAHNWWANGVFVDYAEGNWAEGLTTYMADYGLAETENADAAWQMRLGWLRDFAALPDDRDQPITSFRSKGHDADQVVGYNKVAMVFHMLKQELGDDVFSTGLREFWDRQKFKTAGWSDLQASFEAAAGDRELDAFFDPWLNRKGAPALTLDQADLQDHDGGHTLDLAISSDSTDYEMLIPIQIEMADDIREKTVRLVDGQAEATFDLTEKPLSIGVDQRHDLFRRLAADEAPPILRDVTLAADTLTIVAVNGSPSAAEVAAQLAARTLDTGLRLAEADDDAIDSSPLMLIGTTDQLAPVLAAAGAGPIPPALAGRGTARSWVAARSDAPPALVVEADDEAALSALLRPLPHYGRQSFLVFEGRKAIEKGVWPTGQNALTKRFD